ncbi:MAG TPA: hypothetical protein PKC83_05705 [Gemmatimonadaceae bacterium]|nr:MAG: hypothetical protein ABS52_09415 [Gemmatimonadetes bacterium SCN 70-22]HMN08264.1 hypothetical protein [Gemmatimonadaceae bacterium]
MKKWIVVLPLVALVVAACGRQPAPGVALTGAAAPRLAVEQFLAAVKAQDLQAMSVVWGTDKGPARDQLERSELEKREIIMQGCYDHDGYRILEEGPAPSGERFVKVEITRARKSATPTFSLVKGPSDRWYVRDAGITAMKDFCKR